MPTLHFLFYLLAVAAAYALHLSYLGWFGPYFFSCVIVVPLFAALLSLPTMLLLCADCRVPSTTVKGSGDMLLFSFSLPRFLPPCRVSVHVEVENRYTGERYSFREECSDPSQGQISLPLPTAWCGQLRCRVTKLECRDLLGLFCIRRELPPEQICTVLPAPAAPDAAPDLDAALETAPVLKPKYGGGYSEEHELREYRPGDTVNSIHWKLSSKTDSLIVREPLVRENDQIYVVLSRVGANDRGLELLFWLSAELCRRELSHVIVSDRFYPVGNERETVEALVSLLSSPMGEPQRFDASKARCVFRITDGEVGLW